MKILAVLPAAISSDEEDFTASSNLTVFIVQPVVLVESDLCEFVREITHGFQNLQDHELFVLDPAGIGDVLSRVESSPTFDVGFDKIVDYLSYDELEIRLW